MKALYIVYSDIESVLESNAEKTTYQKHTPAAVGYFFKYSYDDSLYFYQSYRGEDCMQWFADELNQLKITPHQESDFRAAMHRHICMRRFSLKNKKVRNTNHLHTENNYRGETHEE